MTANSIISPDYSLKLRRSDTTTVLQRHCVAASLHHCHTASLPHCTAVSLRRCHTALLPHCIAASLHHCLTASQQHYVSIKASRCYSVMVSLPHSDITIELQEHTKGYLMCYYRDIQDKYKMSLTPDARAQIQRSAGSYQLSHTVFIRTQYDVLRRLRTYWVPRFILHIEKATDLR